MTLDMTQSILVIAIGIVSVLILLKILVIVHRQNHKFKEMEIRMKAMEKLDAASFADTPSEAKKEG